MGIGHGKTEHYSASRYSVSIKPASETNVQKLVASNGRSLLILVNNIIHQDQACRCSSVPFFCPYKKAMDMPQQEEEPFK
jgi:cephalosporin-C deacetylase-like acetyl esterase